MHRLAAGYRCVPQGFQFNMLPVDLALIRQLEVFDLSGNNIRGGFLPQNYSVWGNLTQFR